jgi:hypothetical protein
VAGTVDGDRERARIDLVDAGCGDHDRPAPGGAVVARDRQVRTQVVRLGPRDVERAGAVDRQRCNRQIGDDRVAQRGLLPGVPLVATAGQSNALVAAVDDHVDRSVGRDAATARRIKLAPAGRRRDAAVREALDVGERLASVQRPVAVHEVRAAVQEIRAVVNDVPVADGTCGARRRGALEDAHTALPGTPDVVVVPPGHALVVAVGDHRAAHPSGQERRRVPDAPGGAVGV